MKKILYLFCLTLSFYSCKSSHKKENSKPESKKELKFSVSNSTKFELKNITIGLPDTLLLFTELKEHSKTKWINIKSAYSYGFVRFYDIKKRKYYIQPIDYAGEELHKKGKLKFIIKSIDTINKVFLLNSDYKIN